MSADVSSSGLDSAWGQIPSSRESTSGIGSFTRTRVERIMALVAGLGSMILGAQALVSALGPPVTLPAWDLPYKVIIFGTLALMIVACLWGRGVRIAAGTFAIVYLVGLAFWPLATVGLPTETRDQPWIWYLVNIATLAAVLAFPFALQVGVTLFAPILYGYGRLVQGSFAPDYWFAVGLDAAFGVILGGVILALGWLFRKIAANVDDTRTKAVSSYAKAAASDASEQERMAVAALMHDSVLAALIAAERAVTPREGILAAAMAREALTRLANTEQDAHEGSDEPRDAETIADDIEAAAMELGETLSVHRRVSASARPVPGRVARALALAAAQAVANALQHAGGEGLVAELAAEDDGIRIEVRDAGEGFDFAAVPADRLGIRASIIARVAAVGGSADIDSGDWGTLVRLTWREGAA
ncbi:ATP-binding protein [Microbacterium sp. NPDC077184]|uniref:sensor histidine kinase n=1 Tax=Microbacterium sp. NPDC077184 TaxID=3154764 RepID=UPI00342FE1BC